MGGRAEPRQRPAVETGQNQSQGGRGASQGAVPVSL